MIDEVFYDGDQAYIKEGNKNKAICGFKEGVEICIFQAGWKTLHLGEGFCRAHELYQDRNKPSVVNIATNLQVSGQNNRALNLVSRILNTTDEEGKNFSDALKEIDSLPFAALLDLTGVLKILYASLMDLTSGDSLLQTNIEFILKVTKEIRETIEAVNKNEKDIMASQSARDFIKIYLSVLKDELGKDRALEIVGKIRVELDKRRIFNDPNLTPV